MRADWIREPSQLGLVGCDVDVYTLTSEVDAWISGCEIRWEAVVGRRIDGFCALGEHELANELQCNPSFVHGRSSSRALEVAPIYDSRVERISPVNDRVVGCAIEALLQLRKSE